MDPDINAGNHNGHDSQNQQALKAIAGCFMFYMLADDDDQTSQNKGRRQWMTTRERKAFFLY